MENLENYTREQLERHKKINEDCIATCHDSITLYHELEAKTNKRMAKYVSEISDINEQLDKLSEKPLKDQVKDIHNAHLKTLEDENS